MTARDTVTVGVEEEFHLAEPARRGLAPADPPPRPELVRAAPLAGGPVVAGVEALVRRGTVADRQRAV